MTMIGRPPRTTMWIAPLLALALATGSGSNHAADAQASASQAHLDREHGFGVQLPQGFVIRPPDASKASAFKPAPVASFFIMNPAMAAGSLAGIEPPDLQLRIFHAADQPSLQHWLIAAGLAPGTGGAGIKAYRSGAVSGLEVCPQTLIAPGCSVYVLGRGLVYQMTPGTLEGERILRSFSLLP